MVSFHLGTHSAASSRPSSRASSPTRSGLRRAPPSSISLPSRANSTADLTEGLDDYFGGPSAPSTPGYTPYPPSTPGYAPSTPGYPSTPSAQTPAYGPYGSEGLASGAVTPGGGYFQSHGPVEILLDSDRLVMRGAGGDMNPAYLSGQVELNLSDTTNIKEIHMSLHGKAKVHFSEGSGTAAKSHHFTHPVLVHDWSFLEGNKKSHTLKAGRHAFNFSLMLNGNLPMSMQTYHGDGIIYYKLRAVVVRSGFASNYQTIKTFTLLRTFTNEALEFNQTLEIENTWPGKVMYSLTLPFKAYAAGDDIPVNVKFMPLAKGVQVTSISSVIKEYSLVHTRHSSHGDQRVASCVKHDFKRGKAVLVSTEPARPPLHWSGSRDTSRAQSYSSIRNALQQGQQANAAAGPSSQADESEASEENIEIGDNEVNTFFTIPIPAWTTPSHGIHPVFVTHKIKWSCSIANPDGHVSELRCALPIIILDHSLLDEARACSANTRNLLYGNAVEDESANVDLPSYSNHVYDRVAVADAGGTYSTRSAATTPVNSPPVSRGPSRPGSPTGHRADELGGGSWADAELLRSLGALNLPSQGSSPHSTPPTSNGPSRQLSRHNSRSGRSSRISSRPTSRASSPERNAGFSLTSTHDAERPGHDRRHTGGLGGLLHIPALKHRQGANASKGIMRNNASSETMTRPMSFTNLASARNVSFANEPPVRRTNFSIGEPEYEGDEGDEGEEDDTDPINRVPSYNIAARGFLGGGVVPIDSGLPTYDASETQAVVSRPRSDTALVELGAQAAAEAEERAEVS